MTLIDENDLEYPYYEIKAYIWEEDPAKENGGDYFPHIICRVPDRESAVKAFKYARVNSNRPQLNLRECFEDEDIDVAVKESLEDGPYTTWF